MKNLKGVIIDLFIRIYRLKLRNRIKTIRAKDKIQVLFVVSDLSKWKSKYLYYRMKSHNRFEPIVGVTMRIGETASENSRKNITLIKFLEENKINYVELLSNGEDGQYDIIIYQEPYIGSVPIHSSVFGNINSLFISVHYGFHTTTLPIWYVQAFYRLCWFDCYENNDLYRQIIKLYPSRNNIRITGLPMADELMDISRCDPWKMQQTSKKRIIWAPHHSIGFANESITYSCFLDIADDMINLAIKYKDKVQWAYKPHPWLRFKLEKIWGKTKTNNYYHFWETFESSQAEYGEYVSLFQHSNAMIHDCSSFIIEYLYTRCPVMYLNSHIQEETLNKFAYNGYLVHYKGKTILDIENFINDFIDGKDINREKRDNYFNNYLLPPNGKSACDNIIDNILSL